MSQSTRQTWVSVVIAAVIIVGILAVTAVGGTAFFFYRHVNAKFVAAASAETEFAEKRAKFAGQQPLIEMTRGDEPRIHRELVPETGGRTSPLNTLRVLAYDSDAGKLVHVSIPFWLL